MIIKRWRLIKEKIVQLINLCHREKFSTSNFLMAKTITRLTSEKYYSTAKQGHQRDRVAPQLKMFNLNIEVPPSLHYAKFEEFNSF